jgi:hypothetical protein
VPARLGPTHLLADLAILITRLFLTRKAGKRVKACDVIAKILIQRAILARSNVLLLRAKILKLALLSSGFEQHFFLRFLPSKFLNAIPSMAGNCSGKAR